MTTKKAYALESQLGRYIGFTPNILRIAEGIARASTTLERLNEEECNGHPLQGSVSGDPEFWKRVDRLQEKWEARIKRQSEAISKRLTGLVESLPQPDDGKWVLELQGDPRGAAVVIVAPDGSRIAVV